MTRNLLILALLFFLNSGFSQESTTTTLLRDLNQFDTTENYIKEGEYGLYNSEGKLMATVNYKNNKRHGSQKDFYLNGNIKRIVEYDNGYRELEKSFDDQGKEIELNNTIDIAPAYPGGLKEMYQYMANNFVQRINLSGKIIAEFVIATDGSVTNIKILKGLHKKLDEEAIRMLKSMPKWKPGTQNGIPVRVVYTLPITVHKQID